MNIDQRVLGIIKKNIDKKRDVALESHLIKDLGIDSFDILMIISALEDEFSTTVDDDDFADVVVVADIVKKLELHFARQKQ